MAGLKEAEPELYKSIDAALATIAANGAAASAVESASAAAAKADRAAVGDAAQAAFSTPAKSREVRAAGAGAGGLLGLRLGREAREIERN